MIELKNLTKLYGKTTILQNTDYHFPTTGLVCLLGESGCGKTTLMNLIAGFDSDYSGEIIVDNVSLNTLSENDLCNYRKDYIGFVFQDYLLLSGYTTMENIVYPSSILGDVIEKNRLDAKSILKEMGLSDKINEKVDHLSGGQKQRVAIARALIKNPKIIMADEPTGSLDRKMSTEIMEIFKAVSKSKLVIVITHDRHICEYADEIIVIDDRKICVENSMVDTDKISQNKMQLSASHKCNHWKLACKNFKVSIAKYFLVSCILSLGVLFMALSLSSGNIMDKSVQDFKEKNVVFNNGYIKDNNNEDIYKELMKDKRLENVYKQFVIKDVLLSMNNDIEKMSEKYPMPKTKETMSYGTMPRKNKSEIALSPSLAKKFSAQINELIGKEIALKYDSQKYKLTVSGIYNAGYDDFFVSSDIEEKFYQKMSNEICYSMSYDVKNFEDIVAVSSELSQKNIVSENAAKQVETMQNTFLRVQILFFIISFMILFVSLFIVIVILIKMQSIRYKMVGLLYSFGFNKKNVKQLIKNENMLLMISVIFITTLLFISIQILSQIYSINISLNIYELVIVIVFSSCVIWLINTFINKRLINTSPSIAFKK